MKAEDFALGDHPSDDFAFLRLYWEIPANSAKNRWPPYYKGCDNRAYYDETKLVVDWDSSARHTEGSMVEKAVQACADPIASTFFCQALRSLTYLIGGGVSLMYRKEQFLVMQAQCYNCRQRFIGAQSQS